MINSLLLISIIGSYPNPLTTSTSFLTKCFSIISFLLAKLRLFFKLNFIALRINNSYKLNIYFLPFLFISIISSIIIRSHFINEELLLAYSHHNNYIYIIINILAIFAIIYTFKLILDMIVRSIQVFKIIPEFIRLYKSNVINIKSIISLYYIQNILLML